MSKFVEKLGWSNDEIHEMYKNSQKYESSRQFLGAEASFVWNAQTATTHKKKNRCKSKKLCVLTMNYVSR